MAVVLLPVLQSCPPEGSRQSNLHAAQEVVLTGILARGKIQERNKSQKTSAYGERGQGEGLRAPQVTGVMSEPRKVLGTMSETFPTGFRAATQELAGESGLKERVLLSKAQTGREFEMASHARGQG